MNTQSITPAAPDESTDRRTWFAFGLWLRAGMLGILMLAGVLALAQDDTASLELLVATLMAGSALVLFAWRGARAAFARMDNTHSPAAQVAARPAVAAMSGPRIARAAAALE